jgi:hypothetical protein
VPTALKSGILNLLELSGPVRACNGIAVIFNNNNNNNNNNNVLKTTVSLA